jgi:hypothetical protein
MVVYTYIYMYIYIYINLYTYKWPHCTNDCGNDEVPFKLG